MTILTIVPRSVNSALQRDECAFDSIRCDSLACTIFVQSESAVIFIRLNYDMFHGTCSCC